jgi:hypothetical protein
MGFDRLSIKVETGDGRNVCVLEPFYFTRKNGEVVAVGVGAESDGASTPRESWVVTPPFGWYWLATVLHDYLYRYTQRAKEECDAILLEALEWLAWLTENPLLREARMIEGRAMYDAVVLGGASSFEEDRKNQTNRTL